MQLTQQQEEAVNKFTQFVIDPSETFFVLSGYAGTGKTTLVKTLIEKLPSLLETVRVLLNEKTAPEVHFTATTHKAAQSLSSVIKKEVNTIHSLLGLTLEWDNTTKEQRLRATSSRASDLSNTLVFIDEASYVNKELLTVIRDALKDAKVVFIGDPAQLQSPGEAYSPVFRRGWTEAKLTEVVRQAKGNPIQDLATTFREAVDTCRIGRINIDQHHVMHLSEQDFLREIKSEFIDNPWSPNSSRILACTNTVVEQYNKGIQTEIEGHALFESGMELVSNNYVRFGKAIKWVKGSGGINNNEMVTVVSAKRGDWKAFLGRYSFPGQWVHLHDKAVPVFVPDDPNLQSKVIKSGNLDSSEIRDIQNSWADLRYVYASTIHKSQGSTYDKVFIDLDDMKKIRDPSALARLLYVGVTRARNQVILKGDIR